VRRGLIFSIILKVIKVEKLVASDDLNRLCAITNHCNFVVERHDTDFALVGSFRHVLNLSVNRRF